MQRHVAASTRRKSGSSSQWMVFLSFLACFYVGGRLWQEAQVRKNLMQLARKKPEVGDVSLEETMRRIDIKEQQKKIALLEMEVAAAKSNGYVPKFGSLLNSTSSKKRLLAVVGINTGFGERRRRDAIRRTWLLQGSEMAKLQEQYGVVVRFVVGHSANRGDSLDQNIAQESNETGDFLILKDHVEGYSELPKKTKIFFSTAVTEWEADFYIKVDDDVYLNLKRLLAALEKHRGTPRIYLGCMKSGEVFTEPNQRWHEPEWWKFGDAKYYFRHATGQVYGLSRAVALYISINSAVLHEFKNEDVSLGSWLLGLDLLHEDDRRLCCAPPPDGECERRRAAGDACIAAFEWKCSGLCEAAERMAEVHRACGG